MKLSRLFLLLALAACPAYAEPYFAPETIPPQLLTPPNRAGSAEEKQEVLAIIRLQETADKNEIAASAAERDFKPELVALADPRLTRADSPALYRLLDRVAETSKAATDAAKTYWNTKRPYLTDERIHALIDAHDNPAYPSGHAAGGFLQARVLGMVAPEKRAQFLATAERIAQHRVLVGMHFPKDIAGGKELALLMMGALTQSPIFQQDLLAAQQEVASRP